MIFDRCTTRNGRWRRTGTSYRSKINQRSGRSQLTIGSRTVSINRPRGKPVLSRPYGCSYQEQERHKRESLYLFHIVGFIITQEKTLLPGPSEENRLKENHPFMIESPIKASQLNPIETTNFENQEGLDPQK